MEFQFGPEGFEGALEQRDRSRRVSASTASAHGGRELTQTTKVTTVRRPVDNVVEELRQGRQSQHARPALSGRLPGEPVEQSRGFGETARLVVEHCDQPAAERCARPGEAVTLERRSPRGLASDPSSGVTTEEHRARDCVTPADGLEHAAKWDRPQDLDDHAGYGDRSGERDQRRAGCFGRARLREPR